MADTVCYRCSSANVSIQPDVYVDGRTLSPHICLACGYTWHMDMDPPAMKAVDLYVSREMKLERENAALRTIIADQAVVIDNFQDMLNELSVQ